MPEAQPIDTKSFGRLIEAKMSNQKIDLIGIKSLIERLKGTDLSVKLELIDGAISSVEALLKRRLNGTERSKIEEVMQTLRAEESPPPKSWLVKKKDSAARRIVKTR